jgi:hypothetical protein
VGVDLVAEFGWEVEEGGGWLVVMVVVVVVHGGLCRVVMND